jgi:hypothetical protein
VHRGDDITTFIVPKVEKIRTLNLRIPKVLHRPVAGKVYLFFVPEPEEISPEKFDSDDKLK